MQPTPSRSKTIERERIARLTAEFEARGGCIDVRAPGDTGDQSSYGNPLVARAQKRGRKTRYGH